MIRTVYEGQSPMAAMRFSINPFVELATILETLIAQTAKRVGIVGTPSANSPFDVDKDLGDEEPVRGKARRSKARFPEIVRAVNEVDARWKELQVLARSPDEQRVIHFDTIDEGLAAADTIFRTIRRVGAGDDDPVDVYMAFPAVQKRLIELAKGSSSSARLKPRSSKG